MSNNNHGTYGIDKIKLIHVATGKEVIGPSKEDDEEKTWDQIKSDVLKGKPIKPSVLIFHPKNLMELYEILEEERRQKTAKENCK